MSIEEYFNPTTEQNTRGMCAYSVGGISQCTAVIGTNGIKIYKSSKMQDLKLRLMRLPVRLTFSPWRLKILVQSPLWPLWGTDFYMI